MEKHSKGEFHVLVKKLKPFDREFFFKHIATRHFDFSQRCFTVFVLFLNRLHPAISLADNTIKYFSTPKRKKISSTRKRNYCVPPRCACAKLIIFLSAEKFLKWTPAFNQHFLKSLWKIPGINFWWRFFFIKAIIHVSLLYWNPITDVFQGFVQISKTTCQIEFVFDWYW